MAKVLLRVGLFLIPMCLYLYIFNKNDKKSTPDRTVASSPSARVIKANLGTSVATKNAITKDVILPSDSEANFKKLRQTVKKEEETWDEFFSKAKRALYPETLKWAQKLPVPRNQSEEKIYLRLQLVYQVRGISDIASFLPDSALNPITETSKDYVDDCIRALDPRDDYRERTFMIMYSQHRNSDRNLSKVIFDQVDVLFSETDRFDPGYFIDLSNVVRNSTNLENVEKEEILKQIESLRSYMEERQNMETL